MNIFMNIFTTVCWFIVAYFYGVGIAELVLKVKNKFFSALILWVGLAIITYLAVVLHPLSAF
jgi:hypothetical protein